MDRDTALIWSWLNILTKKRYDALVAVFGGLDRALTHMNEELLKKLGCRGETVLRTLNRLEEFDPETYHKELLKRSLELITIEDDRYPQRLREIGDPPIFLSIRGDLSVVEQPCIGMVGTRAMSPYGRRVVEAFVPPFVHAGMVTVSGLAAGVDSAVAEETLRARGRTIAALGQGLGDFSARRNENLANRIVDGGGLILSEFPLDTSPDKFTFPSRNRIIAGLSLATVVLEAPLESGALITADLALDYSRDVFAVPGQIFDENYAGCHQIIAKGEAKLATSPEDILREIGIVAPVKTDTPLYQPQNDIERVVFALLTTMPQHIDDIIARAKLDTGAVNAALTMMELAGGVKKVEATKWVRA